MASRQQKAIAGVDKKYLAALLVAGALLIAYALTGTRATVRSVEVSFTDSSKSGMQIVPASCASAPPADTGDANGTGYKIPSGTSNAKIVDPEGATGTMVSVVEYFCVTNSGGPTYFLPAHTNTEIKFFLNAVPGLSGVSVMNPGPGNP